MKRILFLIALAIFSFNANGQDSETDLKKSKEELIKKAENGDVDAMINLALEYSKAKDYDKQIEWSTKAAVKGNVKAMRSLGFLYFYPTFKRQDYEKSFYWFSKALERGDMKSICPVGLAYANGDGVNKNLEKAIEYFTLGAEKDNCWVCISYLLSAYKYGLYGQRKNKKLEKYWQIKYDAAYPK